MQILVLLLCGVVLVLSATPCNSTHHYALSSVCYMRTSYASQNVLGQHLPSITATTATTPAKAPAPPLTSPSMAITPVCSSVQKGPTTTILTASACRSVQPIPTRISTRAASVVPYQLARMSEWILGIRPRVALCGHLPCQDLLRQHDDSTLRFFLSSQLLRLPHRQHLLFGRSMPPHPGHLLFRRHDKSLRTALPPELLRGQHNSAVPGLLFCGLVRTGEH